MSEKDFSKLRPFDLEAAKRGEALFASVSEPKKVLKYVAGPDKCGAVVVCDENGYFCYRYRNQLCMAPLAWVRASATDPTLWPVYKGDVLWHIYTGEKHYADRYDEQDRVWQDTLREDSITGFLYLGGLTLEPHGKAPQQPSQATNSAVPEIGDKWADLPAIYGGISLSRDGTRLVHLIVWDEAPSKCMIYEDAVAAAEKINPAMGSHLPTRHQGIDLFDRLQHLFNQEYLHWLLDKTKSGKSAFFQYFSYGGQGSSNLSIQGGVRAVSEIPL